MAARSKHLDPSKVPLRQRPQGNVWAVLVQITQFLLVLAVVAALVLCFLPVIQQSQRLQEQLETNKRLLSQEHDLLVQKRQEIELLKSNQDYVERLARDKLNLGRPGEVIFRFDSYQAEPDSPKP
jgi:cell division protein DivIC